MTYNYSNSGVQVKERMHPPIYFTRELQDARIVILFNLSCFSPSSHFLVKHS